jgi:Coenzyme PQQ synthesis protein D (PqqD)
MNNLYIARSRRVAARSLDGEMMIMSGRDSTLFTLNRTATLIWQAADGVTPLQEIVERRICSEFEVDADNALRDAEVLARELAGHGIVEVSEEPISTSSGGSQ